MLLRGLKIVLEALRIKPTAVSASTDSQCVLAAVRRPGASLKPFFANHIAELGQLKETCKHLCGEFEEFTWVEGKHNPADLGTRPG